MNLQIDVGNTSLKWRILESGCVVARGREPTSAEGCLAGVDLWLKLEAIAIANVSSPHILSGILAVCRQYRPDIVPFVARSESVFRGVRCAYDNPSQLGIDRWLAIIAGYLKYQESCCVIDCGSAITVDIIDTDGVHKGGYIVPGFTLMSRGLSLGTDRVLFGELEVMHTDYGTSTTECVHHGINYMVIAMIQGVVKRMELEGIDRLILTGGDAGRIVDVCGGELCPDLVLDGLSFVSGAVPIS